MRIQIGGINRKQKIYAGDGAYPLVLASVGASDDKDSILAEVEKARLAKEYGADIIIDHTLTPKHFEVQKRILEEVDLPLSAIAVYDMASMIKYTDKKYFTADDVLKGIELKAKTGVDLLTVHASVLKEDLKFFRNNDRIIPCTSRGGTMVLDNILSSGEENFYWKYFDEILSIAKKYMLTISLGAIFRSADISDAVNSNDMYWEELSRNASLVKRAEQAGVSIMVEGIGHCPTNLIPEIVKKTKSICHNAPYRVLTVATDCGLGFDHVSSAIAASRAVEEGADLITAVSRSEHIGLPSAADLVEAVTSAKIAAHCGYIARSGDIGRDIAMSKARQEVGCRGSVEAAIVPKMTEQALKQRKQEDGKQCTMCGSFCALKRSDGIRSAGGNAHD